MPESWRCFPSWPAGQNPMGLRFPGYQKSIMKQQCWNACHLPYTQSLVTIKIPPPQHRGSFYKCAPTQEHPDTCAKETVLKAPSQNKKGKRSSDHSGLRPQTPRE